MTELERIAALTLDDILFFDILVRLVDFSSITQDQLSYIISEDETLSMYDRVTLHTSLTKPTLSAMDADLVIYKQELTDIENARLVELARQDDLKARWKIIYDRDAGMPAYCQLNLGQPNFAAYLRDKILGESDHVLAESRLAAIEAKDILVKSDLDANAYKELRRIAYGPIGDQLDMQYKDKLNNTTTWFDHIAKVKLDIPKL